jgi:hypothetical protein
MEARSNPDALLQAQRFKTMVIQVRVPGRYTPRLDGHEEQKRCGGHRGKGPARRDRGRARHKAPERDAAFQGRHETVSRIFPPATEAGVDLVTLAALLGHSRINMVLRYAHPTEERQVLAIRKMEEFTLQRQMVEMGAAASMMN